MSRSVCGRLPVPSPLRALPVRFADPVKQSSTSPTAPPSAPRLSSGLSSNKSPAALRWAVSHPDHRSRRLLRTRAEAFFLVAHMASIEGEDGPIDELGRPVGGLRGSQGSHDHRGADKIYRSWEERTNQANPCIIDRVRACCCWGLVFYSSISLARACCITNPFHHGHLRLCEIVREEEKKERQEHQMQPHLTLSLRLCRAVQPSENCQPASSAPPVW